MLPWRALSVANRLVKPALFNAAFKHSTRLEGSARRRKSTLQVWATGEGGGGSLTILRASEAVMSAAALSRVLTKRERGRGEERIRVTAAAMGMKHATGAARSAPEHTHERHNRNKRPAFSQHVDVSVRRVGALRSWVCEKSPFQKHLMTKKKQRLLTHEPTLKSSRS